MSLVSVKPEESLKLLIMKVLSSLYYNGKTFYNFVPSATALFVMAVLKLLFYIKMISR